MTKLNEHVGKPFLAKNKTKWNIQFWYFDTIGNRKKYIRAYDLNTNEYLKKVKGVETEINKNERKAYANGLIAKISDLLKTRYFNPETREFENQNKQDLPLKGYLKDYINFNPRKKRSESTKNLYRTYNNVIIEWLNRQGKEDILLSDFDRDLIVKFLSEKEKGSTAHRDHYLIYLKSFFNYLIDYLNILDKNPLIQLKPINNQDTKTNKAYPTELLQKVLESAKKLDIHLWYLMRLVYYTLRRPGELLKLQFRDFDFEKCTISFHSTQTKTNKTQYSILPKELMDEIKENLGNEVNPDYYLFGNNGKGKNNRYIKDKIFNKNKTPFTHFQDLFKVVKNRIKLEKGYTLYSMKHTGIVYCIEELKWDDQKIITNTGHTNTQILGRYSRDAKREREVRPMTI